MRTSPTHNSAGAGLGALEPVPLAADYSARRASPPKRCPAAQRAVRYYSERVNFWRTKTGAPKLATHPGSKCPRYLASMLKTKAKLARLSYTRWLWYHWAWYDWMPDKWARIGACETGYGRRPGNWRHNSGTYQGAFGFAVSSWDSFVPHASRKAGPYPSEAYLATPRQQYEVALAIWRRYGFSGWGCRGA